MASSLKIEGNPFDIPNTLFGDANKNMNSEICNSGIQHIDISKLKSFEKHPFKLYEGEKLKALSDSIKENGLYVPILVRPIDDIIYQYEIVAGHNRVKASIMAGFNSIDCTVRDLTDDESIIAMADTNLQQREEILPSEKAFAYKYKLEAIKSQGKRTDLTSHQNGEKLERGLSVEKVANDSNDSKNQILRYIRLTNLISPLLDKVDEKKMAFVPAVDLSYLRQEEQKYLYDILDREEHFGVSCKQAILLKNMSNTKTLTYEQIDKVITDKSSNTVSAFKVPYKNVSKFFDKSVTPKEFEDTLVKALQLYFDVAKNS